MVKTIFFDVDGTLISHTLHDVPPSTRAALRQLREKGIPCVVATGRHLLELALKEGQLHLQTMLGIVSFRAIGQHAPLLCQQPAQLHVYRHIAYRRAISRIATVCRSTVEPHVVAWAQQKHSLIGVLGVEQGKGRCRCLARKNITGVGYYQRANIVFGPGGCLVA